MKLTDLKVKSLKPQKYPYRKREKSVDRGFGVQVSPAGRKSFYMAYVIDGRERFLKLGVYPECSISEARERCRFARRQVDTGVDPQVFKAEQLKAKKLQTQIESQKGSVDQLFENYINYLSTEKTENSARQVKEKIRI